MQGVLNGKPLPPPATDSVTTVDRTATQAARVRVAVEQLYVDDRLE
jgi:hypothetical protein